MKMQKKGGKHPMKEKKEYEEEVIQIDRVTRVVKGGRRLRFRATVAIGNKKGKVGVGVGKSTEVTGAIQKAIAQAKKTIIRVPMVENTIPHRTKVKFKSAKLLLMPACPGTGIIAGGPLRKILELAGVKDVQGKMLGNNNKVANSQATIMALSSLKEIPWIKKKEPEKKPEKKEIRRPKEAKETKGKPAKADKPKPEKKAAAKPVKKEVKEKKS